MVSLESLSSRGAVKVTWSPPADLCGLTNPQYTIHYRRTTSSPTTHSSMASSSPFTITGLEVGEEYFVRVAVHRSGTFSSWQSVTTCKGVIVMPLCLLNSNINELYTVVSSLYGNFVYLCTNNVPLFLLQWVNLGWSY